MTTNKTDSRRTSGYFSKFPEFTRLSLADRNEFEQITSALPPVADIQFPSVMTWWNTLDGVRVASLNGNLVIQYWRPGDEQRSGLALIGTSKVDQSICEIFDHLKQSGQPVRLNNVPEFVLRSIDYPELYEFSEARNYDEYVLDIQDFHPAERLKGLRRRRIERQLKRFSSEGIKLVSLDLSDEGQRAALHQACNEWWWKNLNNFGRVGLEAMKSAIDNADDYGVQNVCIFAGDRLLGFCLYSRPSDQEYVVLTHVKATHRSTIGFDLIAYLLAGYFLERGVKYANLSEDWGSKPLRMFLHTLGPVHHFRKFVIQPSAENVRLNRELL